MPEASMQRLRLAVSIRFPGFDLDVDQDLDLRGVVGLFGPSGSGKSTLLRVIAGLETRASGQLCFAGQTWQDTSSGAFLPTHRRPVGFVFQDARLFAHLDVEDNLRFALTRRHETANAIGYDEVLATLNIGALLGRRVGALSGGEKQRVAIARTLLTQPRLLLLDEPLAALDSGHKREILPYLEALPRRFGIPAIYVSHAVNEMARLADTVVVLEQGQVTATGSAGNILGRHDLQVSALPFEPVTIMAVRIVAHLPDLHLTQVEHHGQPVTVPEMHNAAVGDMARLAIRAGDVVIATSEPRDLSVRNVLRGTISGIAATSGGAFATVAVDINGTLLQAQLTHQAIAALHLSAGMPVFALIKTATFDRGL